jgi:ADP-ribose pyrophosphatase YjhB (NUDIX family)
MGQAWAAPAVPLKCAGVLPYAYDADGKLLLLLGREAHIEGWADADMWSDFCGSPKPGEAPLDAAAREFREETMGVFGSLPECAAMIIGRGTVVYPSPGVVIYLVHIARDSATVDAYNRIYAHLTECRHIRAHCGDGFLEKSEIRWMPADSVDRATAAESTARGYRRAFVASFRSPAMVAALSKRRRAR